MQTGGLLGSISTLGRNVLIGLLQAGPVPKHVAFIMDGNRRYAKKQLGGGRDGHSAGYNTLSSILDFSYRLGVKEVSVFAFSIENFKRPPAEVENLMKIAKLRLEEIIEHGDLVDQYGIRINVLGDRKLLPKELLDTIDVVVERTKNNTTAILNICMPYTSRDDMTHSIQTISKLAANKQLLSADIDVHTFTNYMYMGESAPLDILVRTSNTTRFSDFMMWEVDSQKESGHEHGTLIEFAKVLWPEYSIWQYFKVLLRWGYERTQQQHQRAADELGTIG